MTARRAPLTEEDWWIWVRLGAYSLVNPLYDCSISQDRRDGSLMLVAQRIRHESAPASHDFAVVLGPNLFGGALEPCRLLDDLESFL